MKKIKFNQPDFEQALLKLYDRPAYPAEIETAVRDILTAVKAEGNAALSRFAEKFDKVKINPANFQVTAAEIAAAAKMVSPAEKRAIAAALENITAFARQQLPRNWQYSPRPGVNVGECFRPMERVGVYIPGGAAPLVSTVIHTAGIAKTAGVKEIAAVTPPRPDGTIHPAVLYAMHKAGVTEIYRLGGVYGIAAIAYGTPTIRKVEKIVGPGNAYVTAAKKIVYGEVALDMVAGPSEIMVIADSAANPEFIAADLLSQAEHGSGLEQAVLLCNDKLLIDEVEQAVNRQRRLLSRSTAIDKVINAGVFLIQVKNLEHAVEIANKYAPEHLELICKNPARLAKKIKAAGAIFLGEWTPEPIGDFCAGPSHVLPTAGSAKYFNGLSVESFIRRSSIIRYSRSALCREAPVAECFAAMEGLDAHGNSAAIRVRMQKKGQI
jgi:histidinol dehydrogenase